MATADPGVGSWTPINMWAMLRALINNGCPVVTNAGAPTNGTSGTYVGVAGPGTLLIDFTNAVLYQNTGTLASPTWTQISLGALSVGTTQLAAAAVTSAKIAPGVIQVATGQISSAAVTGTAAGQLGHAQGVILVPAAPVGCINELISCVVAMDFATAAYTAGGGNVTINISGGGAALTGLVTGTVLIQAAADIIVELVPLAATKNTYTSANGLALVDTVAPTNPGTAAGVINWVCAYRQTGVLVT
jgi:hypothetical protein